MANRIKANLSIIFSVVGLLCVVFLSSFQPVMIAVAQETSDSWPMSGHDPQRTGCSTSTSPDTNNLRWSYGQDAEINTSPAVVNGRVIVGASNGDILALSAATGERIWLFSTGAGQNSIWSSPAVESGRVFIGTRDNNLYCLNATTGGLIWKYLTGGDVDSSPAVFDGRVVFSSNDGRMYCLTTGDGTLLWTLTANSTTGNFTSPTMVNGTVYSASGNRIYATNASNGEGLWEFAVLGDVTDSPCIGNGQLFFASTSGNVYGLDIVRRSLLWNLTVPHGFPAVFHYSPCVSGDLLYVCSDDWVYCMDSQRGVWLWCHAPNIEDCICSSPAFAERRVFVGFKTGGIYCFDDLTGTILWRGTTWGGVVSSPAISDGAVFVSSSNGKGYVYAFGSKGTVPTSVTLTLSATTTVVGFDVRLTGVLSANGKGMRDDGGVFISYSVNDGPWKIIGGFATASDGSYTAGWTPNVTGIYRFRASWGGLYPYQPCQSERTLSVTPFNNQYVFSVSSNSTVSALTFNSTKNELAFTLSGETGTTGFLDVAVAKNLIADIVKLKVYMDGASVNYVATSTAESWILHLTYSHSTHNVIVNLGTTTTVPEFPTLTILSTFMLVCLLATILKKKFLALKIKTTLT